MGRKKKLTYDLVCELEAYGWPGNIRELKNVVENMVVVSNSEYLHSGDLPWIRQNVEKSNEMPTLKFAMEEFEKQFLKKAKEQWGTTEKMAKALDVNQSTISRKLNKYKI